MYEYQHLIHRKSTRVPTLILLLLVTKTENYEALGPNFVFRINKVNGSYRLYPLDFVDWGYKFVTLTSQCTFGFACIPVYENCSKISIWFRVKILNCQH